MLFPMSSPLLPLPCPPLFLFPCTVCFLKENKRDQSIQFLTSDPPSFCISMLPLFFFPSCPVYFFWMRTKGINRFSSWLQIHWVSAFLCFLPRSPLPRVAFSLVLGDLLKKNAMNKYFFPDTLFCKLRRKTIKASFCYLKFLFFIFTLNLVQLVGPSTAVKTK